MPYSKSQIHKILYHGGKPVIAQSSKLPLSVRVSESLIRRNLYALEDQTVLNQAATYEQAYRDFRNQANDIADHYGVRKLDNSPAAHTVLDHLTTAGKQIVERLHRQIPDIAYQSSVNAYQLAYYGRAWVLHSMTNARVNAPPLVNVDRRIAHLRVTEALSDEALKALLGRKPFDSAFEVDIDRLLPDIRASLNRSMSEGLGMDEAMRNLRSVIGVPTDRRSGYKANFYRLTTTTRSYIIEASNSASMAVYQANSDILGGYQWILASDACEVCRGITDDGQKVWPLGDGPMPMVDSHPQCRCAVAPVVAQDILDSGDYSPPAYDAPPDSTFQDWLIGIGMGYLLKQWFGDRSPVSSDELDSTQL